MRARAGQVSQAQLHMATVSVGYQLPILCIIRRGARLSFVLSGSVECELGIAWVGGIRR